MSKNLSIWDFQIVLDLSERKQVVWTRVSISNFVLKSQKYLEDFKLEFWKRDFRMVLKELGWFRQAWIQSFIS